MLHKFRERSKGAKRGVLIAGASTPQARFWDGGEGLLVGGLLRVLGVALALGSPRLRLRFCKTKWQAAHEKDWLWV